MQTISDIIRELGGPAAIEAAIATARAEANQEPLSRDAIYKWPSGGISDRHWPVLIKMSNGTLTAEALLLANQIARGEITTPSTEAA